MIKPEVAAQFNRWIERPDLFVREVFGATPDPWQDEILRKFPTTPRIAMKACKGPGKTCLEAWIAWNFLLTRPYPKIAATSITSDNLRDCLWAEMAVWHNKSPLLQHAFEWQKERIFAKDHPETWWMAARSWSKTADPSSLGNTLAGLHADYILFLLDESGGMPDAIMASAEAALSSCKEGHIVQSGNPTHLEGPLYRACTTERNLWYVVEITGDPDDPMRSPRISPQWARDQIQKYGRDNPWVLVNVFGKFPPASLNALIGPDEVQQAMRRSYREFEYRHAPKVIGVDVAREGDDASVIFMRQGLVSFPPLKYRNIDSFQGAGIVARNWADFGADACFVDATGGFGAGWIDALKQLGRNPIGVQYAGQPHNTERYVNKRAEMYFDCVAWIKAGGQLPNVPELTAALTQTTYSFRGDKLLLEPKEDVKLKLGYSPDDADALCFVAGTQIATPSGFQGIETLRIGDAVLTPFGTATVRILWESKTDTLTTVQFANGSRLTGRPTHDMFVYRHGACALDALHPTMDMSPLQERWKWLLASVLFTKAKHIGFKTLVGTSARANLSAASVCCIGAYGLNDAAQFKRAMKSTILTAIGAITPWKTLNLCPVQTTPNGILNSALSTESGMEFPISQEQRRQSGTALQRAWLGTPSMVEIHGKAEKRLGPNAPNAAHRFGPFLQRGLNSVLLVARKRLSISGAKAMLELAIGAGQRLWLTAGGSSRVAPVSVETASVPPTIVYNITLDRDNAYYANGILAFNCQTFAEPVTGLQMKTRTTRRTLEPYDPFKEAMGG